MIDEARSVIGQPLKIPVRISNRHHRSRKVALASILDRIYPHNGHQDVCKTYGVGKR